MNYLEDKRLLELRFSNGMMMLPFIRYKLLCSKNQGNVISSTEVPLSKIRILYRLFSNLPHIGLKKKNSFFLFYSFNIELENKKVLIIIHWMVIIIIYFLMTVCWLKMLMMNLGGALRILIGQCHSLKLICCLFLFHLAVFLIRLSL